MTSIRGVAVVVLCALVVTGGFAGGFVTVGLFTATESVSGTFSTDESFAVTVVGGDRSSDDGPTDEPGDDEARPHAHGGVENETNDGQNGTSWTPTNDTRFAENESDSSAAGEENATLEDEPPTTDGESDGLAATDHPDETDDASLESPNEDADGGADADDPDAEDASSG
ncbi:hypothetical protein ACFOZ7_20450 [Natribaculum luteum]|uniref:Uncharacterized protein n=1 Tax=Natribaculum luteum TaxID=1586232 RepID=A0ABD5P544_9EURY|nr:hypothetical protein [Natribaculum luteum]